MKKFFGSLWLLLFLSNMLWAQQNWNLDDIIELRKYGATESEILQKIGDQKNIVVPISVDMFFKLKQKGFSSDFIKKFRIIMQQRTGEAPSNQQLQPQPHGSSYVKITSEINPSYSGKIIIKPEPDGQGRIVKGAIIHLMPQANENYCFEKWGGDVSGLQPFKLKVDRDIHVIANFIKNKPISGHERPEKIASPRLFKELRKAGYKYSGKIWGKIEGKGSNKNWGIRSNVYYKYIYQINYTSHIKSNTGFRVKEIRSFDSVKVNLIICPKSFEIDISNDISQNNLLNIFANIAKVSVYYFSPLAANTVAWGVKEGKKLLQKLEKIKFDARTIHSLANITKLSPQFKKIFSSSGLQVIGYPPNMEILDGKSFELTYVDGVGLIDVKVIGADQSLNSQEKLIIERAFYLSDYYIFKDRNDQNRRFKPGDKWQVDARNISGVLEPRLQCKTEGLIELQYEKDDQNIAKLAVKDSFIQMRNEDSSRKMVGKFQLMRGNIYYDLQNLYVKKANLEGMGYYDDISTDHLLFESKLSSQPAMTIDYQCNCEKEQEKK